MKNKPQTITKPVLTLQCNQTRFAVYVGSPGDLIQVSDANCHKFPVQKTSSLVYESLSPGEMHAAEELPIDSAKIWDWIARYMERGLIAEGAMNVADSKHWAGKL